MHLLFAGNTLKFERLKISSEIKGNFKLDGNVLEIALQLYFALRFERLKRIYLFKIKGNNSIFLRQSFLPFNALGMPSFNNSVGLNYNFNEKSFWKDN